MLKSNLFPKNFIVIASNIISLISSITVCFAAKTYYVSTSRGNDLVSSFQAQNPNTPWKTISKVNSVILTDILRPGDQVLFCAGDVFTGPVSISLKDIKI